MCDTCADTNIDVYGPPTPKDEDSAGSHDDPLRKELLWEDREEKHVLKVLETCRVKAMKHGQKAGGCRKAYRALGLPAIMLPLIASALVEYTPKELSWIITTLMLVSGLLSAVNSTLNFGKKAQQHDEYSARFGEVCDEINSQLCRPKAGRIACDVFLERILLKTGHLNSTAPLL